MAAAVETMMYNDREVPWHGLGTPVDGLVTAKEAIQSAELDWTVSRQPVFTGEGSEIDGYARINRDSDGATFGIVGSKYEPIQNAEAFDFMDTLVDSGEAKYETAGSLKGGRVVWMLAEVPRGVYVAGEEHRPYLLLANNHDGSGSCKVTATPVRVVCCNTLAMALGQAVNTVRIRHTGNVNGKIAQAREVLRIGFDYFEQFETVGDGLATRRFSEAEFARFLDSLLPVPEDAKNAKRVEAKRSDVARLYFESPNLENVRGTAWAAYNAVAEYADHYAEVRGTKSDQDEADARTYRAWFRPAMKDKALEVALAI